jgi:hypothetical protein
MITVIGKTIDGAVKAFSTAAGLAAGVLLVFTAYTCGNVMEQNKNLEKELKDLKAMVDKN